MADYEKLKSDIASVIKNNGAGEITGAALQEQMLHIVDTLNEGKAEASKLTELESENYKLFEISGKDNVYANQSIETRKGDKYLILPHQTSWPHVANNEDYVVFSFTIGTDVSTMVEKYINSGASEGNVIVSPFYEVVADGTKLSIGLRAQRGDVIKFDVFNITKLNTAINTVGLSLIDGLANTIHIRADNNYAIEANLLAGHTYEVTAMSSFAIKGSNQQLTLKLASADTGATLTAINILSDSDWDGSKQSLRYTAANNTVVKVGSYASKEFGVDVVYTIKDVTIECEQELARKMLASSKGWIYVSSNGAISVEREQESGRAIISINGTLNARFKNLSKNYAWSDVGSSLGGKLSINGEMATIIVESSQSLVFNISAQKLYNKLSDNIVEDDYVLLSNGWANPSGYLWELATRREIATQSFNSAYHFEGKDYKDIASRMSAKLVEVGEDTECFMFMTDPHLQQDGLTDKFAEFIAQIQQIYNSVPTQFMLCGGDWLGNSDSAASACFKLGYIDGVMRGLFRNYYPLMGNHDTNEQGEYRLSNGTLKALWYRATSLYYEFMGGATRFFCFDTGGEYEVGNDYQQEQIAWFADSLQKNQSPHIAVAMHIIYDASNNVSYIADEVAKIAESFNAKTTISYNGKTYDYSDVDGRVEFILGGHLHRDINTSLRGITTALCASTAVKPSGGLRQRPAIDYIVADYEKRKLSFVRTGEDRNDLDVDL